MPGYKSLLGPLNNPKPLSGNVQSLLPSLREAMGVEPPDAPEPDERKDTAWRYDTEAKLKKALAAKGPGAYVVGVRPLPGYEDRFKDEPAGSWADKHNVEWLHEHVFYLDADGELHDAGYFGGDKKAGGDGGIRYDYEKKRGAIGEFHFSPVLEGGEITREKLQRQGFGPDDYWLIMNNCQDYIEELQRDVLISGRAPQE